MRNLTRLAAATLTATGMLVSVLGSASALAVGPNHAVFVQNDRLEGNQVVAYSRSAEGTLTQAGVYSTGGDGGKLEGSVVDHTASEGSLTYDSSQKLLFAVNAGSNTVSVFSVLGDRLALRQVIGSGGKFPVSVAADGSSVYVLNAEEGGSIQGYAVSEDSLVAIPGSFRSLGLAVTAPGHEEQFTHTPGQVAFSPDGSKLIVTTKAAGQSIDVFAINPITGLAEEPVVSSLPGTVPFGVTFDNQGHLLVAETGIGSLVSYQLDESGNITQLDSVPTEQAATCWVEAAAHNYYYTSNAGSGNVTGFQSSARGQLITDIGNTPTHPGTVDATAVGDFLYVQGGKEGTVDEFEVEKSGSLKSLGSVVVPSAEGGEGIAAS
jgi:6-phosphogluconolactonase (cycloisomerase 2 family)